MSGSARPAEPRPAEGTRERIIATTARHLGELGPRGVELRAICLELGISPSLVNYYFSSPAELLWRAAIHGYGDHVAAQRAAFAAAADGAAAVEAWVMGTIEWTKANPGIAAVIDFPMLALSTEGVASADRYARDLSSLSRENVTTLGSAIWSLMSGRPPARLSTARVAAMIRVHRDFAFWISTVGFGGLGAAMWIAGRKPYGLLWRAFGFSPDRQIRSTLRELIVRIAATGPAGIDPDAFPEDALEEVVDGGGGAADEQRPNPEPL